LCFRVKLLGSRRFSHEKIPLEKIDDCIWRIPKYKTGMRVPGLVFANDTLIGKMQTDRTLWQSVNVTHLPGIYKHSITLPDGHEGYGFPIGGVAATDYDEGVISPGGVGYDINCGVRLLSTNLSNKDLKPKLKQLTGLIFKNVPSGLGSRRKDFKVTTTELEKVTTEGVNWLIDQGLGWSEDSKHCEESGCMKNANPGKVSSTAKKRGLTQLGTLGSGNHFLEIQKVDKIYDEQKAKTYGIDYEGQVTVMIHCGSRGYGHQVCSDYLRIMEHATRKYHIDVPDRELACAPGKSDEAKDYYQAMACAVNYAFSNRQAIMHWVRQSFRQTFNQDPETFGLNLVYDVAHNIAKVETHKVNGGNKKVWIHRKGATRAFPAGHEDVSIDYRSKGQPVLIPGSMGTSSWVLSGAKRAMDLTFGSTAHGAGRMMSRSAAKRRWWGKDVRLNLEKRGIIVKAASPVILAEEADAAYKNVDVVVAVSDQLGIATKVARLVPLAVIKG
jgi:tRNA-splicing ligase RtcB